MKTIPAALLLGVWAVFVTTFSVLWIKPSSKPLLSLPQIKTPLTDTDIPPFNLETYYADKGMISQVENAFSSLLATLPMQILGTMDVDFDKDSYTLAVLGDSMVDTLGKGLPHLEHELTQKFPKVEFKLLNYGVGGSNIEDGLHRLTNNYNYLGQDMPALLLQKPDIIVVESFAYNHWGNTQSDLDRQWLTIAKIIDTIKNINPETKIILAATIAPHCPNYTEGSADLPPGRRQDQCTTVKAYLQNLVNFATSQGYPLADAYHDSLDQDGEGQEAYIDSITHIHPSNEGKMLFSQKVVEALIEAFSRSTEASESAEKLSD